MADWEEKRKIVFARLDAKKKQRAEVNEERFGGSDRVSSIVSDFWRELNDEVDALRKAFDSAVEEGSKPEKEAQKLVDEWSSIVDGIRKRAADASSFLPPYDAEQARLLLAAVESDFQTAKGQVMPRRKFAFRKKKEKKTKAGSSTDESSARAAGGGGETKESDRLAELEAELVAAEKTVENLENCNVMVDDDAMGDVRLLGLKGCVVVVRSKMQALRVDGLRNCHVYVRPIGGSVILHDCQDCVFFLAVRQFRLHTSHRCDFYLRTLSRPIIEHSTAIRMAPYTLAYPKLITDLQQAELWGATTEQKDNARNFWCRVDDFGWHKRQKSPNWHVIPPSDRTTESKHPSIAIATPPDVDPWIEPEEAKLATQETPKKEEQEEKIPEDESDDEL